MGLWHLKTVAPCMAYVDNGSCTEFPFPIAWSYPPGWIGYYNPTLVTCPRHYQQGANSIGNFFYEPGNDRLIAHILLKTTYYPGWDARRYEFDAETGEWLNQAEVFDVGIGNGAWIGVWGVAYTKSGTMGSFSKIYACRNNETMIREIAWETSEPLTGGWFIDPYTWIPKSIYNFAVVNRIDNFMALAQSWTLDCWRNISTTPERFGQLRLPNVVNYLAYESGKYCWVITTGGVIGKADYQIPRWEMLSTVQNPEGDALGYAITFDTKRKRVVVFRVRPDAADGACQHQLEFYYPMVNAGQLTQPVPVTSLKAGSQIILAAHLIGDAGEGVTPYTVNGELLAPVEGKLITPFAGTELNGRVCFQYQAPDQSCEETLKLDVTVEES